MKNKVKVDDIIVVTKENFQSSLKKFKELLSSKLFEYIVLNNDISTSNLKIQDKEGEIVLSEFTICKKVNYPSKDINFTLTTFLVPSLKFHRYANDEITSFSSTFLKYLTNEKSLYDFNLINSANTLSYENIHKRKEFEDGLNLILKDGKPFKKENKTSYYYYPKAFELPSRKYQKKYEDLLKYFIEQIFDENAEKIPVDEKDKENSSFLYKSDKYVSDFKFLNSFLDFKWGQIFEKIDSDTFKVFVDGYKIQLKNEEMKINQTFLNFIEKLKNFFENERTIEDFELEIIQGEDDEINEEFFKNWTQYLMSEENVAEFSYNFVDKNKVKFTLKADKNKEKRDKFQSLTKFISFLIALPKDINDKKKEFIIEQIFYRRINMRNLFPNKMRPNLEFSYHVTSKIDPKKFKNEKSKNDYLNKAKYKDLFINNRNEEEILFGYKLDILLRQLFDLREGHFPKEEDIGKTRTKTVSIELGKDLDIVKDDEEFKKILELYFEKLHLDKSEQNLKTMGVSYKITNIPKKENYNSFLRKLINRMKEIKKNLLLDEEIGISYFYEEIFKLENISIYGTNLKNKIYFAIKQLILEPSNNGEEEIKKVLKKVNVYDISYMCLKLDIDFFRKYMNLKRDEELKERTMTQRLAYIIEETDALKNANNLNEFRNIFYLDEKDKISKKHYIWIDKNKFYANSENIVKMFKDKSDFTINKSIHDNNKYELNIIDPDKFGEIGELSKSIENL